MALDNVNNLENNKVELEFTIEKEKFDAAVTTQFKKNAAKITVPGFRKGKAPRSIIEKVYGKGVFYDDAINDVLPLSYTEALKESGADAVSRPDFEVVEIGENGVKMKAVFYVKPDVTVTKYKGLEGERVTTAATDADVDAEIERTRQRNSRTNEITDRPAQDGDDVIIDYAGKVDGELFEGGSAEKYSLKLGSDTFIPGFEAQVVGHVIGEEFDVNVTFPEDYGHKELAGKAVVFTCKIHEIKFTELPELDDEFAKDVSEFDTLDEYKADVKAKIQKRNDDATDNALEELIIDDLSKYTETDIPAPMTDAEVENIIRDRDYSMRQNGLSLDMYLKYTNSTLDDMRVQVRAQAERRVKTRLALEKIISLENITASDEDIEAEYAKLASTYSMELDKVKEAVGADSLKEDVLMRKAVELLKANAVVTEKTIEQKKAEEEAARAADEAAKAAAEAEKPEETSDDAE